MKFVVILFFAACFTLSNGAASSTASIKPFLVMFGSKTKLTEQDIPLLADYELILTDRFRFHQINNNTWKAIRAASPNTKILLYQLGPKVANNHDTHSIYYLNNLGRFDVNRGSKDGSLNKTHPDWFLKNIFGNRITGESSNILRLDFGNPQFVDYWIKHTLEDISFQEWRADGILIDEATACQGKVLKQLAGYTPRKYLNCDSWDKNMNNYLAEASIAMHKQDQLVAANRGNSRLASGSAAWRELDKINVPLDVVIEEGAFAVHWGQGDVQFFSVEEWQRQIDLPASIKRSAIGMMSHTKLAPNESGVTADGEPTNYEKVLRFSAGSYLLARNLDGPSTYFMFVGNRKEDNYNKLINTELYGMFDIGVPITKYEKMPDKDVYFRKYSDGYVYVNPTDKKIENIKVAVGFRPRADKKTIKKIGESWYLDLKPHDATIAKPAKEGAAISTLAKESVPPSSPNFGLK